MYLDPIIFIEEYCLINREHIKLNSLQKKFLKRMSYIKGWNYALDKAIDIIKENLGVDSSTTKVIEKLKEQKVYAN